MAPRAFLGDSTGLRQQRKVAGTFVGATAFTTVGEPYGHDWSFSTDRRPLDIRLAWDADANFVHSHPAFGSAPDGRAQPCRPPSRRAEVCGGCRLSFATSAPSPSPSPVKPCSTDTGPAWKTGSDSPRGCLGAVVDYGKS